MDLKKNEIILSESDLDKFELALEIVDALKSLPARSTCRLVKCNVEKCKAHVIDWIDGVSDDSNIFIRCYKMIDCQWCGGQYYCDNHVDNLNAFYADSWGMVHFYCQECTEKQKPAHISDNKALVPNEYHYCLKCKDFTVKTPCGCSNKCF